MMGRRSEQASLFYQFQLDDRVPKDHLLRRFDRFVTPALADIHERLHPYYSEIGRPSFDPELMIRMLVVGYCYGLRSAAQSNLALGPTIGLDAKANKRVQFGYGLNYLIDIENAVIVDIEATQGELQ